MKLDRLTAPVCVYDPAATHRFHPEIRRLRKADASGVYVIYNAAGGAPLYVGESHTGRLYGTLTRHFQRWDIPRGRDALGRINGGVEYDRRGVLVRWAVLDAESVEDAQADLIAALDPRDNTNSFPEDDDEPAHYIPV